MTEKDCEAFKVLCGGDAWVDANCKKTCGKCRASNSSRRKTNAANNRAFEKKPAAVASKTSTTVSSCKDTSSASDCEAFKVLCGGDAWVDSNCKKTCGKCPPRSKQPKRRMKTK